MKRLAIYLMCGRETPELAAAAVEGGADLIELGFPFSDPLADGPVIRRAGEKALAAGMRTRACLDCLAQVRARVAARQSRHAFVRIPATRARSAARRITGPSASGSEKGKPISTRSAPPCSAAAASSGVSAPAIR